MKMIRMVSLFLTSLLLSISALQAAKYKIDMAHSDISFKVSHMVVSKVTGKFEKFSGEFIYDDKNPTAWVAEATIDATSINTSNADRDKHLRNADFFDVEKYPTLTFKSTGVSEVNGNKAKLAGVLTMLGVSKPVVLDLTVGGVIQNPWGGTIAGFEASTVINRKDFGLSYGKVLDNGGLAVGEEVEILIHVEGVMEKAEGTPAGSKKKK